MPRLAELHLIVLIDKCLIIINIAPVDNVFNFVYWGGMCVCVCVQDVSFQPIDR